MTEPTPYVAPLKITIDEYDGVTITATGSHPASPDENVKIEAEYEPDNIACEITALYVQVLLVGEWPKIDRCYFKEGSVDVINDWEAEIVLEVHKWLEADNEDIKLREEI